MLSEYLQKILEHYIVYILWIPNELDWTLNEYNPQCPFFLFFWLREISVFFIVH